MSDERDRSEWKRKQGYLDETKCSCCGKVFIPAPMHMYRMQKRKKSIWQCSYTCYNKEQVRMPKKAKVEE